TAPADYLIEYVRVKTNTPFSGGGISTCNLTVGVSGNDDAFLTAYDLTAASSATNIGQASPMSAESTASQAILATFTPDGGANLDDLTDGSVTFFIRAYKLQD